MSSMNSNNYTWSQILVALDLDKGDKYYTISETIVNYFYDYYGADVPGRVFNYDEFNKIVNEIKKDIQYQIQLKKNEEDQDELKKEYPNIDKYLDKVCNHMGYNYE
jgi:hypothetical protein